MEGPDRERVSQGAAVLNGVAFSNSLLLDDADRRTETLDVAELGRQGPGIRRLGLLFDFALVLAAASISLTYLAEIEAVCLIDVFTGDRERLMAKALQAEMEFAKLYELPVPDTADDPGCLNTTGSWLISIMFGAIVVFLGYNVKVWGLPLVLVSILIASYTCATVLNWYFFGAEDQNKYLITILSSEEPRSLAASVGFFHDALVNQSSGLLGRFINVLLILVFPYVILGALFGKCAGGQSLIKLAFPLPATCVADPPTPQWFPRHCSGRLPADRSSTFCRPVSLRSR